MDPAFAELLNQMKARGWTDAMFGWLVGLDAAGWAQRVNQIDALIFDPRRSTDQRNQLIGAGSWEAAQRLAQGFDAPPAPTAAPVAQVPEQQSNESAFATIRSLLDSYGLGGLADWAWKRFQDGASVDLIMNELYQRPEFKAAYPEYETLAKKGRAYSVGELIAYRKAVVGIFRSYGIPEGFYDTPQELAEFAANEVSIAEISKRVAQAADAVYQSSPLVREEMERMYGVTAGDLFAYWLDIGKAEPIIRQNYVSAQIGAQARNTGFGTLTTDEAQRLAGQGVDQDLAERGFTELARSRELFGALDAGETDISRETQLGAAFGGDADAQQTVERRRSRRLAEFQEGGGFATTAQGIAGVA